MQNKFHNFFKKLHNLWVQSAPIISTVSSILFGIFLVVVLEPISNFLSTVMEALIILFISGIVLGLLEKKIKYSREERFTFISLVLLFTFVPTVYKSFFTSNTSASITLSLLIVLFAIRYLLFLYIYLKKTRRYKFKKEMECIFQFIQVYYDYLHTSFPYNKDTSIHNTSNVFNLYYL